ncbi:hypothetical protein Acsp02_07060 [Actinoplanes sp. NBRC 103695]|nr:hypothetical protein Acsp02_07060 [Actinoplanes sp. NBRC 103695]
MIFNRPVGPSGNPRGGFYMTRSPAENNADGTGWHTPPVEAGDNHVQITAVVMSNDLYTSLLSIMPVDPGPTGAWLIKELPSGGRTNSFIVQPRKRTETDRSGC